MTSPGGIPQWQSVTLTGLREPFGVGLVSAHGQAVEAQRFTPQEIARVLGFYDLGQVRSARQLLRGTPDAPKAVIESDRGKFLLKRRAPGHDDPLAVAAGHTALLHVIERGFPAPGLIGTREDNNSMLQIGRQVYELFEFIEGAPSDGSVEQCRQAGEALAALHGMLATCHPRFEAPVGSYHASPAIEARLERLCRREGRAWARLGEALLEQYRRAADEAEHHGFAGLSRQLTHADWHPGNLLFRDGKLVAVVDFESPRIAPRIVDAASGALQFALVIVAGGMPTVDARRAEVFLEGYRSDPRGGILPMEGRMLGPLTVEALIGEAVLPIEATGRFGPWEGRSFLEHVLSVIPEVHRVMLEAAGVQAVWR
ncbi:MAG: phosphotransferase [Phycisphaeraceae bacterium]|nr:phosphotransferase [Phycisphaeraceae bacterium]